MSTKAEGAKTARKKKKLSKGEIALAITVMTVSMLPLALYIILRIVFYIVGSCLLFMFCAMALPTGVILSQFADLQGDRNGELTAQVDGLLEDESNASFYWNGNEHCVLSGAIIARIPSASI